MTRVLREALAALACVAVLVAVPGIGQAASLNLNSTYPDLFTSNASANNAWHAAQCFRSNGNPVTCTSSQVDPTKTIAAYGVFTITGTAMTLNPDGSGSLPVSSGTNGLGYTLTANFDSNGVFTGGTLVADGVTSDPSFQSGTIVNANLSNFGFSGSGSAGIFEFQFNDPAMTGDFANFYNGDSGVIASTFNMSPGWTGSWDPTNNNNPLFWQGDFSAAVNVDSFVQPVPLPAALWLFGSGGLLLVSLGRRRRAG